MYVLLLPWQQDMLYLMALTDMTWHEQEQAECCESAVCDSAYVSNQHLSAPNHHNHSH